MTLRWRGATIRRMAITLRTDEKLDAALTRLAAAEGRSRQEIITRLVFERDAAMDHRARVAKSSERMAVKWAAVYDALVDM